MLDRRETHVNSPPTPTHSQSPVQAFPIYKTESVSERTKALAEAFANKHAAVLLLDACTTLPEASLSALTQALFAQPTALFGCRIVDARRPQRIQLPGWRWSEIECEWRPEWLIELKADQTASKIMPCDWLNPNALLVPRQVWETVGGLDSRLDPPLAVVDWCLRARRAGFPCYEVQNAPALIHLSLPKDRASQIFAHLATLPGTLTLAHKHHLPIGRLQLSWRLLVAAINDETGRVRFWADYGYPVRLPKRGLWYLRNLLLALRRERVRGTIKQVVRSNFNNPTPRASR